MNEKEYLQKLVDDFGEINGYTKDEKIEFGGAGITVDTIG